MFIAGKDYMFMIQLIKKRGADKSRILTPGLPRRYAPRNDGLATRNKHHA